MEVQSKAPPWKFPDGTRIYKMFVDPETNQDEMYEGVVVGYEEVEDQDEWMYKNRYNDGDTEDLTKAKVEQHLQVN